MSPCDASLNNSSSVSKRTVSCLTPNNCIVNVTMHDLVVVNSSPLADVNPSESVGKLITDARFDEVSFGFTSNMIDVSWNAEKDFREWISVESVEFHWFSGEPYIRIAVLVCDLNFRKLFAVRLFVKKYSMESERNEMLSAAFPFHQFINRRWNRMNPATRSPFRLFRSPFPASHIRQIPMEKQLKRLRINDRKKLIFRWRPNTKRWQLTCSLRYSANLR